MSKTLEDKVKEIVEDFIKTDTLFTALDVSNEIKKTMPFARHREIRDIVRSMYAEMQNSSYGRTPIQVTLADGSQQDALLYHPLSDSWDLDTKYDAQKRTAVAPTPAAVIMAPKSQPAVAQVPSTATDSTDTTQAASPAPAAQPTDPKQLWSSLFGSAKLFPTF